MKMAIGLSDEVEPGPVQIAPGAEHMADFAAPEIDGDGTVQHDVLRGDQLEEDPDAGADFQDVEIMGFEAFFDAFKFSFLMPSMFSKDFAPLAVTEADEAQARTTAQIAYDLLQKHAPRALAMQFENAMQYAVAGQWVLMKITLAANIMRDQKIRRLEAVNGQKEAASGAFKSTRASPAANENRAPSPMDWMDAERAA
jgi:hypothetical protein